MQRIALDARDFRAAAVQFSVHLLPRDAPASAQRYPVLYLNEGQGSAAMWSERMPGELHAASAANPAIVVAIDRGEHAGPHANAPVTMHLIPGGRHNRHAGAGILPRFLVSVLPPGPLAATGTGAR